MQEETQLITMRNIDKIFPGVKALINVDFELKSGEIHALLGENGAGKSTLIKVLTGVEALDGGEILLEGKTIRPTSPHHAQMLGISTVYQEVNLCTNLSVAENIYIGREPMKQGRIDWAAMNANAKQLLARFGIQIDVSATLNNYSIALQQMVAIARAVDISAKALILDEPTSSLTSVEVKMLFEIMNMLKAEGIGILFVTHFLDQVYEVSDRITVLRNGELVGTFVTAELPKIQLIGKMIGKEYEELERKVHGNAQQGEDKALFLQTQGLQCKGNILPVNINIYKGEVLGLAGLLGSGRSETVRMLFGVDKSDAGSMQINGRTARIHAPIQGIRSGLALCPENRKTESIVGPLSVRDNIILALQAKKGMFNLIGRKEAQKLADTYIQKLQIKTPSADQAIGNLSGGNQQKVILARWLATDPNLLMLDEPTRGIDIGTKAEIQKIVVELAGEGMAIVFISSEIDEELRCCERMLIFRDQQIIAELSGSEMDEHAVMEAIAGGESA